MTVSCVRPAGVAWAVVGFDPVPRAVLQCGLRTANGGFFLRACRGARWPSATLATGSAAWPRRFVLRTTPVSPSAARRPAR